MKELKSSKVLDIRFSEVDSMNVVWHGSYPLYFEDAREKFGEDYGLDYPNYLNHGYFAPLISNISSPFAMECIRESTLFIVLRRLQKWCLITKFATQKMSVCWPQATVFRCLWIPIISLFGIILRSILSGKRSGISYNGLSSCS